VVHAEKHLKDDIPKKIPRGKSVFLLKRKRLPVNRSVGYFIIDDVMESRHFRRIYTGSSTMKRIIQEHRRYYLSPQWFASRTRLILHGILETAYIGFLKDAYPVTYTLNPQHNLQYNRIQF
jgi:hypothetical protein